MRRCSTAKWTCGRRCSKQVQERIEPYGLGVEVLDAPVALIAPPDEVKSAFDDVAREQTRIATKVNNAEQEAESQWRTALSDKYRIEQETAAYTDNRKTLARARGRELPEPAAPVPGGPPRQPGLPAADLG